MRVELQDVRKIHMLPGGGFVTVLAGVDLVLESGQAAMLRGESGCGKSSLINIMGGLSRPTSGSVRLDGTVLNRRAGRGGAISHAFQDPVFIPELTVMENLLLPLARCREQAALDRGESLLELFGLAEAFDRLPADLSGGEKRRLNLARALIATPRLLLLDEPFAGLGEGWEERALELVVKQARDTRATLVIASTGQIPGCHGFRQLRLHQGKVITDGNDDC
jgi:ABC-type multidrug transport system ATPase subunit